MKVKIKKTNKKGRGVFTTKKIESGEIIEICEIISVKKKVKSKLKYYVFEWKKHECVVLGNGSLFNHSKNPNCTYVRDYKNKKMMYVSLKHIKKGEELTINYNGSIDCKHNPKFI